MVPEATTSIQPLRPDALYRCADLSALSFTTTAEIEPLEGVAGQKRAKEALDFGTKLRKSGFNLFVIGENDSQMRRAVEAVLKADSAGRPGPTDWIYVNNFKDPRRPVAISLPPGRAVALRVAMHELIDDLQATIPAVFASDDYQTRRGAIDQTFQGKQNEAFSALRDKASGKGLALLHTPTGFVLAPMRDGQVVQPDEFNSWPEEKRREIHATVEQLEQELERVVRHIPRWEKERRDEVRKLNRQTAESAVGQTIEETKRQFADLPRVIEHLEAVRTDLIANVGMFATKVEGDGREAGTLWLGDPLDQYEINVLVSHGDAKSQVIVDELHPTLANLVGSVEHGLQQGALVTNFRLIKAGALHRANGGFLLLDVRSLLQEPFSWQALKRTLRQGEVRIEDIGRFLGINSTVSLEPDAIPLNVKVVLFGERILYHILDVLDPELRQHFKVLVDFEDDIDRSPDNEAIHARMIAAIARSDDLRPVDRDGVRSHDRACIAPGRSCGQIDAAG